MSADFGGLGEPHQMPGDGNDRIGLHRRRPRRPWSGDGQRTPSDAFGADSSVISGGDGADSGDSPRLIKADAIGRDAGDE
jgi:hypothetical protein